MTWDAFTQAVPTASSPAAKITPVAIAGHHAPAASCPRPGSAMRKVLILTNDFPPRAGGIQSFVHALAMRLPVGSVTVYAPAWHGAAEFDASLPFPVVRHPTSLMLPIPSVARRAAQIIEREGCDTVLFGAAAPLALLGPWLRKAGARRLIAITHGHEAGWAALPVARNLLRRIGDSVDTVTYLGEYTRTRLARALSPSAVDRMARLAPGVDVAEFHPGNGGGAVRDRLGLGQRPVVVCVSRLVPRKGQDTLIRAWPQVRVVSRDAVLLLVGDGPYRDGLRRLARKLGVADSVIFAGAVPRAGLPVIGGDSGNAPDTIREGETGYVVPAGSVSVLAERLARLVTDPAAARVMGEKGVAWVHSEWRWDLVANRLQEILA